VRTEQAVINIRMAVAVFVLVCLLTLVLFVCWGIGLPWTQSVEFKWLFMAAISVSTLIAALLFVLAYRSLRRE